MKRHFIILSIAVAAVFTASDYRALAQGSSNKKSNGTIEIIGIYLPDSIKFKPADRVEIESWEVNFISDKDSLYSKTNPWKGSNRDLLGHSYGRLTSIALFQLKITESFHIRKIKFVINGKEMYYNIINSEWETDQPVAAQSAMPPTTATPAISATPVESATPAQSVQQAQSTSTTKSTPPVAPINTATTEQSIVKFGDKSYALKILDITKNTKGMVEVKITGSVAGNSYKFWQVESIDNKIFNIQPPLGVYIISSGKKVNATRWSIKDMRSGEKEDAIVYEFPETAMPTKIVVYSVNDETQAVTFDAKTMMPNGRERTYYKLIPKSNS